MLDEIEEQLTHRFEDQAPRAAVVHEGLSGDVQTRVSLQRDRHGKAIFRYWFGESRVQRATFQTLTCSEARCPQHQALRQKWLEHVGQVIPRKSNPPSSHGRFSLALEERIQIGDRDFTAREALFPVVLNCPQKAHASTRISITGWDVFDAGGYLAGGMVDGAPLFVTLELVRQWLQNHCANTAGDMGLQDPSQESIGGF